ncbi:FAD-dependent thymidylate synthase [Moraxella nasovis]|uniref:FAD-dependent thymidylate synthase n=1 Tax=Moraxella nasovis TaxID=2904121 RepID=UPI001F60CC9C|nr:FAD-dependent thymidylate synthase [Moraxella nasovis]UNU74148.1 FAD-dependent thymidylate synthase [Moraxella nasovis]
MKEKINSEFNTDEPNQNKTGINVEYIDHMGNDNSVVTSARVSYSKRAKQFPEDENARLIKYLATHKHEIPFAHTAITLRVEAPISIRTQCFKHKIGFVENEVSRRYIKSKPKLFIPKFRQAPDGNIKQGSGAELSTEKQNYWQKEYEIQCQNAIQMYEQMIENGIAPEQARFVLPQGVMTEWVWTGSLLAYARFYNLRSDSHAQKEIQELAKMVSDIIALLYPISWHVLTKGLTKK